MNYNVGFCLFNEVLKPINCLCCYEYTEEIFLDLLPYDRNCFFKYYTSNCDYCLQSCKQFGFTNYICKMNKEFKSGCYCCNNNFVNISIITQFNQRLSIL